MRLHMMSLSAMGTRRVTLYFVSNGGWHALLTVRRRSLAGRLLM